MFVISCQYYLYIQNEYTNNIKGCHTKSLPFSILLLVIYHLLMNFVCKNSCFR